MKRILIATIASTALAAVLVVVFPPRARSQQKQSTAREKIQSVSYLIGTWDCAHTVGTFKGRYKTTYSTALGGMWLKQTYDFPPGNAADATAGPVEAEVLMGYDERRQAWVRFFANSLGQYFPIRMTDVDNGWAWKYVSFFPRKTAETPEPDATMTRKSDTQYVIDGPSYDEGGTHVTEHHTCQKVQ